MRFANWSRPLSVWRARSLALASGLAFVSAAAFSPLALAVTFYKWTGADGTVHYGDAPPKGFTGNVERVDVHPGAHTLPPSADPKRPVLPEPGAGPAAAGGPDLLTQRRETRARLEANLEAARERLDLARKALAEASSPQDGEWQYTVGGPPGPGPQVARSNCHKNAYGRMICPGRVPSAAYYSRVQALENAVKRAESDVRDAERAYRQGVD